MGNESLVYAEYLKFSSYIIEFNEKEVIRCELTKVC